MCGLAGLMGGGEILAGKSVAAGIRGMTDRIANRGPDDHGEWVGEQGAVGLGHRRLSILDLSEGGHQPMLSASGRYVLVFNGEVYNFRSLRAVLEAEGVPFRSESDSEVILACFERYGIAKSLQKFVGMFAIACWDTKDKRLFLCRDRLGIKPLYFGWQDSSLIFASELKCFEALPGFDAELDIDALALLMRRNCIPAPHSIYKGVQKVLPGELLSYSLENGQTSKRSELFWDVSAKITESVNNKFLGTEQEALVEFDSLLEDAIRLRMVADVPLGAFLSGGYDSSLVVSKMQEISSAKIKTFSIGFDDTAYDEAASAREVAARLGTDHTELYVTPEDAMAVIPELPAMFDEPFADSSQIPTYLVSKLARGSVTVALSGDGGDELFGGYNRHVVGEPLWRKMSATPRWLRTAGARLATTVPPSFWDRIAPYTPLLRNHRMPGDKIHKLSALASSKDFAELFQRMTSHWNEPEELVPYSAEPRSRAESLLTEMSLENYTQDMMFSDLVAYLPDDILTKVDRASMAVSLEARVPLIDHRLVEFAWQLPMQMKLKGGVGKHLIREAVHQKLPRELMDRPKMGFGMPIGDWLKGPLRDWAENLLEARFLEESGLNERLVRARWRDHLAGRGAWQYHIWDVLMYQGWRSASSGA